MFIFLYGGIWFDSRLLFLLCLLDVVINLNCLNKVVCAFGRDGWPFMKGDLPVQVTVCSRRAAEAAAYGRGEFRL